MTELLPHTKTLSPYLSEILPLTESLLPYMDVLLPNILESHSSPLLPLHFLCLSSLSLLFSFHRVSLFLLSFLALRSVLHIIMLYER